MNRILLVEDEYNFARFVELELKHEGYVVGLAYDGNQGLIKALQEDWDLILLDLMLPGLDGFEVCRGIRKHKTTPIIMLTARDSIGDRVSGLDLGADDYIAKPFDIVELFARMRAIQRRVELQVKSSDVLTFKDIVLKQESRTVTKADESLSLTKREFDLLAVFMSNINRVLTRDVLLDNVWGYNSEAETNVVDVYVRYLRKKLGGTEEEGYIQTVRGAGYVMR